MSFRKNIVKVLFVLMLVIAIETPLSQAGTVAYWEFDAIGDPNWADIPNGGEDAVGAYGLTLTTQAFTNTIRVNPLSNPDTSNPWSGGGDNATDNPSSIWIWSAGKTAYYYPNPIATHDSTFDFDPTKSFTVEGWFSTTAQTGWVVGNRTFNAVHAFGGTGKGWSLNVQSAGTVISFAIDGAAGSTSLVFITASITPDVLYHFAAMWDSSVQEMRLYLDGILVASAAGNAGWNSNRGGQLSIGARDVGTGYDSWNFNGRIDEVRYSDAAISPDQFLNFIPPTVAYWELDGVNWDGRDAVGVSDLLLTTVAFDAASTSVPNPDMSTPWKGVNDATANPKATLFSSANQTAYYRPNPIATHESTFDFNPTKSFTVEGWFSATAQTGWIVGNRTFNTAHAFGGTGKGWSLNVQSAGTVISFAIDGAAGSTSLVFITASITPDVLYHFAAMWDSSAQEMKLYLDGILVASAAGDAGWNSNRGGQLSIGSRDVGTGYDSWNFNGSVDEVRYSRIVLSPDQFLNYIPPCGSQGYLPSDFNEDCRVDFVDFESLALNWFLCNDPVNPECN